MDGWRACTVVDSTALAACVPARPAQIFHKDMSPSDLCLHSPVQSHCTTVETANAYLQSFCTMSLQGACLSTNIPRGPMSACTGPALRIAYFLPFADDAGGHFCKRLCLILLAASTFPPPASVLPLPRDYLLLRRTPLLRRRPSVYPQPDRRNHPLSSLSAILTLHPFSLPVTHFRHSS